MATRCNLYVLEPQTGEIQFYRHWDGYPDEAGRDFAEAVVAWKAAPRTGAHQPQCAAFVAKELIDHVELEPTGTKHGDTEWEYRYDVADDRFVVTPLLDGGGLGSASSPEEFLERLRPGVLETPEEAGR